MGTLLSDHATLRWSLIALMCLAGCLAVASLTGLVPKPESSYYADRDAEIGHVVMFVVMIGMTVDTAMSVPMLVWQIAFGALAFGFVGVVAVRIRRRARIEAIAANGYLAFAAVAMFYATLGHGSGSGASDPNHHHMSADQTMSTAPPLPVVGWVMVVALLVDAILSVVAVKASEAPWATRLPIVPHIVMDGAMALMLISVLP